MNIFRSCVARVIYVAVLAGWLGQYAQAAERIDLSHIDPVSVNTMLASRTLQGSFEQRLQQALQLDARNSFRELKKNEDKMGNRHTRYQQLFDGVPVYGEQVIVHGNTQIAAQHLTGMAIDGIENDIDANDIRVQGFSKNNAMAKARKSLGRYMQNPANSPVSYRNEKIELVIYLDAKGVAQDVWYVSYVAEAKANLPVRPFFIIDADDGSIIRTWNGMAHTNIGTGPGGNEKIGQVEYGVDRDFLDVTKVSSTCTMNNAAVKTVNMNNSTGTFNTAFSYFCPRNTVKAINGAYSPLNDGHYFGGIADAMYRSYVGAAPLSAQVVLRIHYDTAYENAFWDGEYTNFGDGASFFYPLSSSLNVVAHEMSHGTTEQNSGLEYTGQSGGINEAYSDIAGEAAEYYAYGQVDWLVGADVMKGNRKALRYFDNPAKDKASIGNAKDYYDGIDVHHSSGVFNRAYYLLANTAGWNPRKAFEVFYYANVNYWVPSSNYVDAACGVLSAAGDLAYDKAQVNAAFQLVGVTCPVPVVDVDGDYMDDGWETLHGLNPLINDSAADPDGDGLSNREEYFAGTDPQNPDSDGDKINDAYDPLPNDTDWLGFLTNETVINRGDGAKSMAGYSLGSADIDGDGNDDVIIGSPYYDLKYYGRRYTDIGFVVVISGATGDALWFNIGSYKGDLFGKSVAGTSDLDSDGIDDFVVGIPGRDVFNMKDAGSVAAYNAFNVDPTYGPMPINTFDGNLPGDRFGFSVDGAGDIDNDGVGEIVVGAPGVDTTNNVKIFKDAGAVFVYEVSSGQPMASYFYGATKAGFGFAVAGIGDITGDGHADVIAGAPLDDSNGKDSGSLLVMTPWDNGWHDQYVIGATGSRMGSSVASAGDVNNDGIPDFMAGFPYGNSGAGGVSIWRGTGTSTTLVHHLDVPGAKAKDYAGTSVAVVSDVNNDGYDDILMGSPGADILNATTQKIMADAGMVQLLSGNTGVEIWSAKGKAAKDYFGWTLASGDVNADGAGDAIIGAKGADVLGGTAGKPRLVKDVGSVSIINGKAISP